MTKRLLMIDDDSRLLGLVRNVMEEEGWEFEACSTGRAGFAQALRRRPSVILLDLRLPDMDGWNLLRRFKTEPGLRSVPVAMISGVQRRPEDKVTGLVLGADDYISKPFDCGLLVAKLHALTRSLDD